jgi:hypothetical protein
VYATITPTLVYGLGFEALQTKGTASLLLPLRPEKGTSVEDNGHSGGIGALAPPLPRSGFAGADTAPPPGIPAQHYYALLG